MGEMRGRIRVYNEWTCVLRVLVTGEYGVSGLFVFSPAAAERAPLPPFLPNFVMAGAILICVWDIICTAPTIVCRGLRDCPPPTNNLGVHIRGG